MKRLLMIGAVTLTLLVSLSISRNDAAEPAARHHYRLKVHGTAGVKLRMLLITKSDAKFGPERREEIVTVPANIDFKGTRYYAWFDTLPNGMSGNDGDRWGVDLAIDGKEHGGGVGMDVRKDNLSSASFGDL